MLDYIMGRDAIKRDILDTPDFKPNRAILNRTFRNPSQNRKLAVLIHPWHNGGKAYGELERRLLADDFSVLSYRYHDQLLKPNVKQVLESFNVAQETGAEDIDKVQRAFDETHLIGASLGCVALALIAEALQNFDSATMVTAGSDLAKCVWEGSRSQRIRRQLEDDGCTEEELVEAWQPIAPINHIGAFQNKTVHLITSKTDTYIPTVYQDEFVRAMTAINPEATLKSTRKGHLATIGIYCYFGALPKVSTA